MNYFTTQQVKDELSNHGFSNVRLKKLQEELDLEYPNVAYKQIKDGEYSGSVTYYSEEALRLILDYLIMY